MRVPNRRRRDTRRLTRPAITRHPTMREVLEAYPGAQHALFGRYHIGGCNSCGYEPGHTLEAVAGSHNIVDVAEVVGFVEGAEQLDRRIQVSPVEVAAAPGSEDPPGVIDVRTPAEWELARIGGSDAHDRGAAEVAMRWANDTPIVFYCRLGQRSPDAASYFAGQGFTDLRSMTGGIEAWSLGVDPSVSRYEFAPDTLGGATLRPPRSAVSQVEGCQSAVAA